MVRVGRWSGSQGEKGLGGQMVKVGWSEGTLFHLVNLQVWRGVHRHLGHGDHLGGGFHALQVRGDGDGLIEAF